MTEIWPKAVAKQVRDVRQQFGTDPEVTQPSPLEYHVTLRGEHITATAYLCHVNGKTKWTGGKLEVDGQDRPVPPWDELVILWNKLECSSDEKAQLESVPSTSLEKAEQMPGPVKLVFDRLFAAIPDANIQVGYDGQWVIGVDGKDGDGIRFFFRKTKSGPWMLYGKHPIQVVAGGRDISHEIGSDISKAIAALTGKHPEDQAGDPVAKTQQGKRDIGIEMRKGNVIRV